MPIKLKIMAIGGFFKLPRHKQFEFKARYYDADKEEFEKRVGQAELEVEGFKKGDYVPNIKGKMRKHLIDQKRSGSPYAKVRKLIIAITVFLLFILFYYLITFFDILAISR